MSIPESEKMLFLSLEAVQRQLKLARNLGDSKAIESHEKRIRALSEQIRQQRSKTPHKREL